jgi:Mce-associated membrane protein
MRAHRSAVTATSLATEDHNSDGSDAEVAEDATCTVSLVQGASSDAETTAAPSNPDEPEPGELRKRRIAWTRVLTFGVLPGLALLLAICAGLLRWNDTTVRDARQASIDSVNAATQSTIAMLSYQPDTVEKDLGAARDRLTGSFKDSYASLIHDIVVPGAQQKRISAVAKVPAAASVSATENHAVVLVFVNQTTIIGADAPSDTASSVRVTLDKVDNQWLISNFEPV